MIKGNAKSFLLQIIPGTFSELKGSVRQSIPITRDSCHVEIRIKPDNRKNTIALTIEACRHPKGYYDRLMRLDKRLSRCVMFSALDKTLGEFGNISADIDSLSVELEYIQASLFNITPHAAYILIDALMHQLISQISVNMVNGYNDYILSSFDVNSADIDQFISRALTGSSFSIQRPHVNFGQECLKGLSLLRSSVENRGYEYDVLLWALEIIDRKLLIDTLLQHEVDTTSVLESMEYHKIIDHFKIQSKALEFKELLNSSEEHPIEVRTRFLKLCLDSNILGIQDYAKKILSFLFSRKEYIIDPHRVVKDEITCRKDVINLLILMGTERARERIRYVAANEKSDAIREYAKNSLTNLEN